MFEKCQTQKFAIAEARVQKRRSRRTSRTDYGLKLKEKQRLRFRYGLRERQFSRYVKEAIDKKQKISPAEYLFRTLESRLDRVVYQLGFAGSQQMARQLVSHGHISLDGQVVKVPSCQVKIGEKITIREGSKEKKVFVMLDKKLKEHKPPSWLSLDPVKKDGELKSPPMLDSMYISSSDIPSVVEFYKK